MEFNMEWNVICRVCLQEGQMQSIYECDDKEKNLTICDKIMTCSNITIKRGMNLPEQICKKCLEDLNVAHRFRTNCESSDSILQSFIEGNVVTDLIVSSGSEIYKYKPPEGLDVKRVRSVKLEPNTDHYENEESLIDEDQYDDGVGDDDGGHIVDDEDIQETIVYEQDQDQEATVNAIKTEKDFNPSVKVTLRSQGDHDATAQPFEMKQESNVCTIKLVKTNKARAGKATKEKVKIVTADSLSTNADGTTVIRVRRNTEEQKPLKICEICGNTYKYKHALESHMRRHRNEKPFSCEICGRAFVINFELRRHMRTHTGQKPYECRFCGRKFSDFGSRIKHERTHTGERPYTCETCGKSFAYSHVLSSHILTHTGEKRFVCTTCGKRFTKSHHLKAHWNTHLKGSNKPVMMATLDSNADIGPHCERVVFNNEEVYQDVLTVLTAQPKIEAYSDEIEQIEDDEEQNAVESINMG